MGGGGRGADDEDGEGEQEREQGAGDAGAAPGCGTAHRNGTPVRVRPCVVIVASSCDRTVPSFW